MTTASELIAQMQLAQPDAYFIRWFGAGIIFDWEPVKAKPVKIRGWEGYDFFSHRNDSGWRITEGHTGKSVVTRGTLKEAKGVLLAALDAMGRDAFDDAVVQAIFDTGLSPRYKWKEQQP